MIGQSHYRPEPELTRGQAERGVLMEKFVKKCPECGKSHNFGRCPKCGDKVYDLDPTLEVERCSCNAVLHKDGKFLCDGRKDGGKCGALIDVPQIKRKWQLAIAPILFLSLIFAIVAILMSAPLRESSLSLSDRVDSFVDRSAKSTVEIALRSEVRTYLTLENWGRFNQRVRSVEQKRSNPDVPSDTYEQILFDLGHIITLSIDTCRDNSRYDDCQHLLADTPAPYLNRIDSLLREMPDRLDILASKDKVKEYRQAFEASKLEVKKAIRDFEAYKSYGLPEGYRPWQGAPL